MQVDCQWPDVSVRGLDSYQRQTQCVYVQPGKVHKQTSRSTISVYDRGRRERKERRTALEKEVTRLQKSLAQELNLRNALNRGLHRPLGSLPRIPNNLPVETRKLLFEVAVLEEEVLSLEKQVVCLREQLLPSDGSPGVAALLDPSAEIVPGKAAAAVAKISTVVQIRELHSHSADLISEGFAVDLQPAGNGAGLGSTRVQSCRLKKEDARLPTSNHHAVQARLKSKDPVVARMLSSIQATKTLSNSHNRSASSQLQGALQSKHNPSSNNITTPRLVRQQSFDSLRVPGTTSSKRNLIPSPAAAKSLVKHGSITENTISASAHLDTKGRSSRRAGSISRRTQLVDPCAAPCDFDHITASNKLSEEVVRLLHIIYGNMQGSSQGPTTSSLAASESTTFLTTSSR
ncbi:unnamed protein product [Sphagnum compactum]